MSELHVYQNARSNDKRNNQNKFIKNKGAHQHLEVSKLPKFLIVLFIICEVLNPSTWSTSPFSL